MPKQEDSVENLTARVEKVDIAAEDNGQLYDGEDDLPPEPPAQEGDQDCDGPGGHHFNSPQDREEMKRQRQQLWQWLKRMGANMFKEGINLTKVSLPVCLFEPRSFLERLTTNWEYLDLLVTAANCKDPADRMKYVVAFAIGGLCRQVSFHKPFNPIIGETYQATHANGVQVFCEQVSHHPPVSSWQVTDPSGKFCFYGNGNWSAGVKGNAVKARQSGINTVQFFADGAHVTYELPAITVKGVLWGERYIKYGGEMVFRDVKNDIVCEVLIDPQPHQSFLSSWFRSKKAAGYKPDMVKGTLRRGDKVLDTCTGNWLQYLEWEHGVNKGKAKRLWDRKHSIASIAVPVKDPIPSDCRFREDLVYLKQADQLQSQDWKILLEEQQRKDRKLRKEGGCVGEQ